MLRSDDQTATPPFPGWRFFVALLILTPLGFSGCRESRPASQVLASARRALKTQQYSDAIQLVSQVPEDADQWLAAQMVGAESARLDGQSEVALSFYLNAATDAESSDGQLAAFAAAEIYFETGRLAEAEASYRNLLKRQPNNGATNYKLGFLLAMTGRRWESLSCYYALLKGGDADFREAGFVADVDRPIRQPDLLSQWKTQNPNAQLVRLAVAADLLAEGNADAKPLLASLVQDDPDLLPAQALLGELMTGAKNPAEFLQWHRSLPAAANQSAEIWFIRGMWARNQADLKTAAECFRNATTLSPVHRRAMTSLGQVLTALGDDDAADIVEYSVRMMKLTQVVDKVLQSDGRNAEAVREAATLLEGLGRTWEACAWAVIGRDTFPEATWHAELLQRNAGQLNDQLGQIAAAELEFITSDTVDFDCFNDTIAEAIAASQLAPGRSYRAVPESTIRFAANDSIAFEYSNADDPATPGVRMFEQTGGGVAVLDFDHDGAPDVFLPQGTEWQTGANAPTPSGRLVDQIHRNNQGQDFTDATTIALPNDSGYGQGATAGDFNNDGFSDLYVANIGQNGLYKNMGDGTFTDVTAEATISDASWTASAVMCDLNADDLPDIFDVNYLKGDGVFELICNGRGCSPRVFDGAPDRMLINLGNGQFEEVPDATPTVFSKGLGTVVFETQPNRRPSLFIANDQVANSLLKSEPADNSHDIILRNGAVVAGVAYNDQGLTMACMGVAIDDLDGNGLLDIFTTNFQDESNTLYFQDTADLYREGTKAFGLQEVSLPMTGWGTQALDADLDGWPDLVVTNGHVDDGRDFGGDYHQRAQFFRNLGTRFEEQQAESVGAWFDELRLGRGLARVDWNLDGQPDFISSNMNAPVSVLENVSAGVGHFVSFRLHATRTARDAVGARVTVVYGDREVTRQLLAGDGYMACNERLLTFGLGESSEITEVVVRWPSGAASVLTSPPVDATYHVTEDAASATRAIGHVYDSLPITLP